MSSIPPPPLANSFVIGTAVINTHTPAIPGYQVKQLNFIIMMMMSFICSCRNKNQPNALYPRVLPTIRGCLEGLALIQKQLVSTHNILLSAQEARHRAASKNLAATQASAAALGSNVNRHAEALHDHREHIQHMLCNHDDTMKEIGNHTRALLNHRDEIRSTQKEMTSKLDTQQAMMTSIQEDNTDRRRLLDAHGTCINSMQQDIKDIKSNLVLANNNGDSRRRAAAQEASMHAMQQDIRDMKKHMPTESERNSVRTSNALAQQRVIDLHARTQDMQREIKMCAQTAAEMDRNNALAQQRVIDLHTRTQNMQLSMNKNNTTLDSLVSANNAMQEHISSHASPASVERQVQVQVLGPRTRR
jgi:hypothetical protein